MVEMGLVPRASEASLAAASPFSVTLHIHILSLGKGIVRTRTARDRILA